MSVDKLSKQKPTVLESQQQINDAASRLDELQGLHARGDISSQRYEDEEQLTEMGRARAQRQREEAIDRQTGRKVSLRTKVSRAISKQLFG